MACCHSNTKMIKCGKTSLPECIFPGNGLTSPVRSDEASGFFEVATVAVVLSGRTGRLADLLRGSCPEMADPFWILLGKLG